MIGGWASWCFLEWGTSAPEQFRQPTVVRGRCHQLVSGKSGLSGSRRGRRRKEAAGVTFRHLGVEGVGTRVSHPLIVAVIASCIP